MTLARNHESWIPAFSTHWHVRHVLVRCGWRLAAQESNATAAGVCIR
jgi:hypothetical protein